MLRGTILAFDDYIPPSTGTVLSSTELNEILGRTGQLSLHAVIDDVLTGGTFDLFVEGSNDGRNWIQRNSGGTGAGNGDISIATLATGASYQAMFSDGASGFGGSGNAFGPLMPYLRLRMTLGTGSAHVAVHATFRDPG